MKNIKNYIPLFLFVVFGGLIGCQSNNYQKNRLTRKDMDLLVGKKMDVLIAQFGLPDYINPRSNFQVLWGGRDATVALTYVAYGKRVFIAEDCTIIAAFDTKDYLIEHLPKDKKLTE